MAASSQVLNTKFEHTQFCPVLSHSVKLGYKIYPSTCQNFIFIAYLAPSSKKEVVYDSFFVAYKISDLHTYKLLATWVEENESYKDAYVLNNSLCYKSYYGQHVQLTLDEAKGVFVKTTSEFKSLPEVKIIRSYTKAIPYVGSEIGKQYEMFVARISIEGESIDVRFNVIPKPAQVNSEREDLELRAKFGEGRILFAVCDFKQNIILGSHTSGLIKIFRPEKEGHNIRYIEDKTATQDASFLKTLGVAFLNFRDFALKALVLPNENILLVYLFKEHQSDKNYSLGIITYDLSNKKIVNRYQLNISMTPYDFSNLKFNYSSDGKYLYFNYLEHSFVELGTGRLTSIPRVVSSRASSCLLPNGLLVDFSLDAHTVHATPPYNDFEVEKMETFLQATPLPPVLVHIVRSYLDRNTLFAKPKLLENDQEGTSLSAHSVQIV